ncbi:MAG TPA: 50S ribosomal protein L1 [bacterium]|jgi:large subunit ribosomal protein L1|nr:50S ribosomal protein L1 [bacterium]
MKRGKRYRQAVSKIERERLYEAHEALELLKELPPAKFDETVETHIRLNVDPRRADQQVRGAVVLPHGTGKTVRILVFAKGEKAKEAEDAGAYMVGDEDIAEKIQGGWLDFDVAVATPDLMSVVGRLGRLLGPKGLMPNPKAGTVTMDVGQAVKDIQRGKVEYRVDKHSIVHVPIGRLSFTLDKLAENYNALLDAVIAAKPAAVKGQYIRSIAVSSTMSPGLKINQLRPLAEMVD